MRTKRFAYLVVMVFVQTTLILVSRFPIFMNNNSKQKDKTIDKKISFDTCLLTIYRAVVHVLTTRTLLQFDFIIAKKV